MRPTRPADRRRRKATFQPEMLESRQLLTGGAGNTFAIMQATVPAAGSKVTIPFSYTPSLITLTAKHQITLGIDVAAQSGSTVVPKIVGVENLQTHQMMPMTRANYSKAVQLATPAEGKQTTAILTTLKLTASQAKNPQNYAVVVEGQGKTTGALLAGFYLPGDANGDGTVDATDVAAIKQAQKVNANSQNYVFADDANRDGVINSTDLRIAEQNLGASVNITPVVAANLNPAYDSGISDRITNIQTVQFNGTATPGATVTYTDTDNTGTAATATADISGAYSLMTTLGPGDNTYNITATDAFGQKITGEIAPVTYSLSAPTVATPSTVPTTPTVNLASTSTSTSGS